MASKQDTANRKAGSSQTQADFNQNMAESQRDKTAFRASKVHQMSDKYNPERLQPVNHL